MSRSRWCVESIPSDTTTIDTLATHQVTGIHDNGAWGGFEHRAAHKVEHRNHQRQFRNLSLTSRRMRALAQPFLFQTVVVDAPKLPFLARTLATPDCLSLAKAVRSICVMAPSCRARTLHEFEHSHPAWRDPDVVSMAAAYSVTPPPKRRARSLWTASSRAAAAKANAKPLSGRTCADMLAFEGRLLTISAGVVLKMATALEQFRVVPLADARLTALPRVPFHRGISLSLSPLARSTLDDGGDLSACIDKALFAALPLVSAPLHQTEPHRFPNFREYTAGDYSQCQDLAGVVQLVAAARDVQSVSCLGSHSRTKPWVTARGTSARFPSRGPLTTLRSLDLTECQLKPQALVRMLKSCPALQHLRIQFSEGFVSSTTAVLGKLWMEGLASRLTSLVIQIPTVIKELFNRLGGHLESDDGRVRFPLFRSIAAGFDKLEYLDMPASAIWDRREETVSEGELENTQRLVKFLPRRLRTLALRGILAVPAVQLEALADECGRRGRFPWLRSVLLDGPTPLLAEYGGDPDDFDKNQYDVEEPVCTGGDERGKDFWIVRGLDHRDDCKCWWGQKVDRQRPALERVEAKFRAKGVRFRMTQGFLWSAAAEDAEDGDVDMDDAEEGDVDMDDGDDDHGPSEDEDVDMEDNMDGLTDDTKAWLASNGLA